MGSAFLLSNAQSFSSGDRDSPTQPGRRYEVADGVYTKRFNIRHKFCGNVFAGSYKALIVGGGGNGYLKTVCDYVHLNPVRAKLIGPERHWRLSGGAAMESISGRRGNVRPGCGRTGCWASTGSRRTARQAGKNLPGKWSVVGPRKKGPITNWFGGAGAWGVRISARNSRRQQWRVWAPATTGQSVKKAASKRRSGP